MCFISSTPLTADDEARCTRLCVCMYMRASVYTGALSVLKEKKKEQKKNMLLMCLDW